MKTHITTLNNMAGTASLAHRRVLKVAQCIGCHEMGLSFYPLKPDYAKEIDKRLDGIIAPLNYGDIVIFQYPSWIGVNYDELCKQDKVIPGYKADNFCSGYTKAHV